jgi:hypothetical protein
MAGHTCQVVYVEEISSEYDQTQRSLLNVFPCTKAWKWLPPERIRPAAWPLVLRALLTTDTLVGDELLTYRASASPPPVVWMSIEVLLCIHYSVSGLDITAHGR